jgi:hypothetical protein
MTEDIALEAVSQSKEALSYIPHELKTDEVCLRATAADIGALEYVPQAMVQLCLERWLRDPSPEDWREFPARFRTPELAAQAIKRNPHVIEEIPVDEHTQEMCDAFLEGGDYDRHLEDIAMSARSKILCITCLRVNRGPIEVVPANLLHNPEIQEANQLGSLLEEE